MSFTSQSNQFPSTTNAPLKVKENIVWNPFDPMPEERKLFMNWMFAHRDSNGKANTIDIGVKIVIIQEGNMGGSYWRMLWPKDSNNIVGDWWQSITDVVKEMDIINDGEKITIKDNEFVVHKRVGEDYVIDLERIK